MWSAVYQRKGSELFDLYVDKGEKNNIIHLKREDDDDMKKEILEYINLYLDVYSSVNARINKLDDKTREGLWSLGYIK